MTKLDITKLRSPKLPNGTRLCVENLKIDGTRNAFQREIGLKMAKKGSILKSEIDETWQKLKNLIIYCATETSGEKNNWAF